MCKTWWIIQFEQPRDYLAQLKIGTETKYCQPQIEKKNAFTEIIIVHTLNTSITVHLTTFSIQVK